MITITQALVLGLLQGITELFPISSLGHSVIVPALLGWHIESNDPYFLPFLVATHLATALVLFFLFWKDWRRIITGILRSLARRSLANDRDARLGWLLVAGTIPAGLLGLIFEKKLERLFAAPKLVAAFLFLNGIVLVGAEYLRKRSAETHELDADARLSALSWKQAIGIGTAQALALLPGFSRTGAAMSGGLLADLSHEDSARFAFLLATPIIAAAAVLELPKLAHASGAPITPVLVGALASGAAAWASIKFLMRYFKTNTLTPLAVYCLIAGGVAFLLL